MAKTFALLRWFKIDDTQPDIALAQLVELQRQVPLLYALLIVNACAVAYTHLNLAPSPLIAAIFPLVFLCAFRLVIWLKRRRAVFAAPEAIARLRRTIVLAGVIAVAYITWSLCLDGYGGAYERGHVALFIAITVIGCIFCLMYLPQAALLVTAIVTVPYLVYYVSMANTVFTAIAVNILLVTAVMLQVVFNNYRGFTALIRTQAETRRLGEENRVLAHTDVLTGLPNRRHYFSTLEAQLDTSTREATTFAVGVLDLDRFKPINDTYGHILGDRLLAEVGSRLRTALADGTMIARLGGDEFGFIAVTTGEEALSIGQTLCDLLSQTYVFEGNRVSIGCSCGVAVFPDAGRTVHELFDRSDYALYNSKTSRRGVATLYSTEHENRIRSERAIEVALQAADLDAEMQIYLQPIVDIELERVVAVEALARWTSPTLGPVAPNKFISVAERSGIIHQLTLLLLRKSLEELDRLPPDIDISFNLSAHDITNDHTVLAIIAALGRVNADPRRIILELTETAVMRNFDVAARSIRLLRSRGIRIAVDDFGTGFSSLGYLHRLTVDKVKIDRSFVSELHHPSGRNIIAAIVALCWNLELECVVEGVEGQEQLSTLRKIGCRVVQGYLFGRPMTPAQLKSFLAQNTISQSCKSAKTRRAFTSLTAK